MRVLRSLALLVCVVAVIVLFVSAARTFGQSDDGLMQDPSLDRSTPRRALNGFMAAAERGDYSKAAQFLDLRVVPKANQQAEAPDLAQQLGYVITHTMRIQPDKVTDNPEGLPNSLEPVVAGTANLEGDPVPIALERVGFPDGDFRWVVARSTVAMIPAMYNALSRSPLEEYVPHALTGTVMGNAIWQWLALLLVVPIAILMARALSWVVFGVAQVIARWTATQADDFLIASSRRPGRLALAVLFSNALIDPLRLTLSVQHVLAHMSYSALTVAGGWFAIALVGAFTRLLEERIPGGPEHELAQRGSRTRLVVLERVAEVLVTIVAIAVVLVQFDVVRSIGVSLLASAGIAGIVVGIAAQRSLAAIIAGVQISITQPIRLGDTVVIEGENGTIEEIMLTYVVVRLWDERRMVVPVTRFLEQPFQNWTKVDPAMTGTVTVACDFDTPVERVRTELVQICRESPHWDSRVCSLQVVDAGQRAITLRAVVSSAAASGCWELRCEVREKLVRFLHTLEGGRYLPRSRDAWFGEKLGIDAEAERAPSAASAGTST